MIFSRCVVLLLLGHASLAVRVGYEDLKNNANSRPLWVLTVNILKAADSDSTPTRSLSLTELLERKKVWVQGELLPDLLRTEPSLSILSLQEVDEVVASGIEEWGKSSGFLVHKSIKNKDAVHVLMLVNQETFPKQSCSSEDPSWVECHLQSKGDYGEILVLGGQAPNGGIKELKPGNWDVILADAKMKSHDFKLMTNSRFEVLQPPFDGVTACKYHFDYRKLAGTIATSKNFDGLPDDVTCAGALCQGDKKDGCCVTDAEMTATCKAASAICSQANELKPELQSLFQAMGKETTINDLKLKTMCELIGCKDKVCQQALPLFNAQSPECKEQDLIAVKASRFIMPSHFSTYGGDSWLSYHKVVAAGLEEKVPQTEDIQQEVQTSTTPFKSPPVGKATTLAVPKPTTKASPPVFTDEEIAPPPPPPPMQEVQTGTPTMQEAPMQELQTSTVPMRKNKNNAHRSQSLGCILIYSLIQWMM